MNPPAAARWKGSVAPYAALEAALVGACLTAQNTESVLLETRLLLLGLQTWASTISTQPLLACALAEAQQRSS